MKFRHFSNSFFLLSSFLILHFLFFLPSFFPSFLASFLPSFLPSFLGFLPSFLPWLPSFHPSFLPSLAYFLPSLLTYLLPYLLTYFLPSYHFLPYSCHFFSHSFCLLSLYCFQNGGRRDQYLSTSLEGSHSVSREKARTHTIPRYATH